ncbi:lon protease homolog 1, mitochondrial-like [Eutrema salsugineum]|uniref:lon protease homolog 1, mitochondrial-like n=1 Tax=Eutrema salsugineum TaxID=72664 RepID=UPI000CED09C8|nr:lon protease homolog 1, mitochondrial-like [Eutrema salsugineum]
METETKVVETEHDLASNTTFKSTHIGDFRYPYLPDFGAAIPCGRKHQAQQVVMQEVDLTLRLGRKEMEIVKIENQFLPEAEAESGPVLEDQFYIYLPDFGAAIPCGRKHQAQQVIQEVDLTLRLGRQEMEIVKIEERNQLLPESGPVAMDEYTRVGVAMALSLTSTGGSTLYMETRVIKEAEAIGYLYVTGYVGEETIESADIAYTVAKQILLQTQPKNNFFANSILCLDLPRGKGTSAGCTITTSLLSLAMNKPVRKNLSMTGTITPTGRLLRIGSVKEKTIGARQSQVKTIIFPEANRDDFDELENYLKEGLDVHFVHEYKQIFDLVFGCNNEDYQTDFREEYERVGIEDYVGKSALYEQTHVGVSMWLAMTYRGGSALYVTTTLEDKHDGEGCLPIRSQPGEELLRSLDIAFDLAYQILLEKKPENTFFEDSVLSIYLPTYSTINGTSAGCTILTSFLSLAMDKPVRKNLAMAGTLTPTGKILGIASVKEMTIGARRTQVTTIIFPEANRREFYELEDDVKQGIDVHFVDEYEQIFELVFGYNH